MVHKCILILLILTCFMVVPSSAFADQTFWSIQSIDTMKYSRDRARDKTLYSKIPQFVKQIADMGPTHIAIATPYDDEFLPTLKIWVAEARKNNLNVWFRGNWSSWEGWFDYPRFKDFNLHHQKTAEFIKNNQDLFQDGDIFTPAPEPENGGIGDPRTSNKLAKQFNQFLVDSYASCAQAFFVIHIRVACGYYSVNGDIAKDVLTTDTVQKSGNVVVIDHYVKDPQQLVDDIKALSNKFNTHIVLGEFGAPIPGIHGFMNEAQQADYIKENLNQLVTIRSILDGVNYWTAFDGSTELFTKNDTPKQATKIITDYYNPGVVFGTITNSLGDKLKDFVIKTKDGKFTTATDSEGNYTLALPKGTYNLVAGNKEYKTDLQKVEIASSKQRIIQDFSLTPQKMTFLYRFRLNLKALFGL